MPWILFADIDDHAQLFEWPQPKMCLHYLLGCNLLHPNVKPDPFWSYSVTAQFKVLAQKEGSVDQVTELVSQILTDYDDCCAPALHDNMTLEYLMNPDNGFYDKQTDSMIVAVDFQTTLLKGVSEYVVVAQNELKLKVPTTSHSMHIGHMEWEINFDAVDQEDKDKNGEKSLVLSCKDVAKGRADKVLLELFSYRRDDPNSEAYSKLRTKFALRHLFTAKDNKLTVKVPAGSAFNNIILTFRLLKERSQFPDFTEPTAVVAGFSANVILRVGDKKFHVNKQFLSSLSSFFNGMFNGLFDAATQPEVELGLDMHSAELFHHFLLVLCVHEALPNSVNVAALFKLAHYYNAETVRVKCAQHIRMAKEMPIEKRMQLARCYCNKETQALIMDNIANFEELKRITLLLNSSISIYYEAEI